MNNTEVSKMMQIQLSVRVVLSILPCLLFLYVNSVMVFALWKKPLFLESPRYLLFGHLLFTDSLQLLLMMLLYLFALTMIRMVTCVCVVITHLTAITVKLSPINLAVMSVERYVAICFPLRHATIATPRTTGAAIFAMWTVASLESCTQLFLFFRLNNADLTTQGFCNTNTVFRLQVYMTLNRTFTIVNFVLVSIIIIYTYAAVMVSVKSSASFARKTENAYKVVLLHIFQLFLYLISTLFNMINSSELLHLNPAITIEIEYILFLGLIVLPKCLSPLIYGLKDQTFVHVFQYYFTFGFRGTLSLNPQL